jgi:predicted PhzF superfamily epimerase YddE/YHI9
LPRIYLVNVFAAGARDYLEATGIAAAALVFGLLANGMVAADDRPIRDRQGRAMGRPSEIALRFRLDATGHVDGCWLGGVAALA